MPAQAARTSAKAHKKCKVALLLIDVINDMEFPEGNQLSRYALKVVENIAALKRRAKELNIPVIYVNDNFGRWQESFHDLVKHCLDDGVRGEDVARRVLPEEGDHFVLKPKHSGFFSTSLGILLKSIGAETLILTGFATNICVLYTANDAYMHDYQLYTPCDCMAAERASLHRQALSHMEQYLKADIRAGARIQLRKLKGPSA